MRHEEGSAARRVAVVGGGPAGLRAAEVAVRGGAQVTLFEAQRSVGRKFLIAGKSGLNLTNGEEFEPFLARYSGCDLPTSDWRTWLSEFDNEALRAWAAGLGIETFVAKSGKVLPNPVNGRMRSTPLLRRWLERLRELGVAFKTSHRWIGFGESDQLLFEHQGMRVIHECDATILALGGASWPKTGSDGAWTSILAAKGIHIESLRASNCGWEIEWPAELLREAEGLPLKNLELHAKGVSRRGELVITRYGLEGGPIYRLGPALRAMAKPELVLDFKPELTSDELQKRMGQVTRNFVREARRRLNLDPGTCALLKYLPDRGPWRSSEQLVHEIKNCHIKLSGPRPIAEAISTAGGVSWSELDSNLMLKQLPGVYVAGEMIDWDAPTGGYLLQACFATGSRAGNLSSGDTAPG
ncbi:MAG: putative flavoprotein (TIGR03862 family) [Planctomycetota bacterium]